MRIPSYSAGFSLIELSIVLVILGLLVGGILGGQSLIEAAEMRSVATDMQKFQTATNAFRGKYGALPGDISNATQYWGKLDNDPNTCKAIAAVNPATCDGDGNGSVITDGNNDSYNESLRYWQHLANAGLIEGTYTGKSQTGDYTRYDPQLGVNVPVSKMSGAGYFIWSRGTLSGVADYFDATYNQFITFGREYSNVGMSAPALTTAAAYGLDAKFDDGKPGTGNIMAWKASATRAPGCTDSDVAASAQYTLANTAIACSLIFKLGK